MTPPKSKSRRAKKTGVRSKKGSSQKSAAARPKKKARRFPDREVEMYEPVAGWLRSRGYTVRGEVRKIDIVGLRGEELVAIELKLKLNLELLFQATRRARLTDQVYVCLPRPLSFGRRSRWTMVRSLTRRLGLGLLLVEFYARGKPLVREIHSPGPFQPRPDHRGRKFLLREFHERSQDRNPGGSHRRAIITGTREILVHLVVYMHNHKGAIRPRGLVEAGLAPRVTRLIPTWRGQYLERESRGLYRLIPGVAGQIRKEYPELWKYYQRKIPGKKSLPQRPKK